MGICSASSQVSSAFLPSLSPLAGRGRSSFRLPRFSALSDATACDSGFEVGTKAARKCCSAFCCSAAFPMQRTCQRSNSISTQPTASHIRVGRSHSLNQYRFGLENREGEWYMDPLEQPGLSASDSDLALRLLADSLPALLAFPFLPGKSSCLGVFSVVLLLGSWLPSQ